MSNSAVESRGAGTLDRRRAILRGQTHRVPALVVLLLGLLGVQASLDLGLGTATNPGPGLWPLMVCGFTASAAAVLVLVEDPFDHERWTLRSLRIGLGLAVLAAFVWMFSVIGFVAPAAALMLFWLKVFAAEPWRLAVPVALGTAVALHLVFVVALGVPFPEDILVGGVF